MNKLILFISLILITSCEYEATENYVIDNQSSYDITFNFIITKWTGAVPDSHDVFIESDNSAFLYQDEVIMAHLSSEGEDFLYKFDTITVKINDTLLLTKDINNFRNWEYNEALGRVKDDNCHIFVINDSDLTNEN